MSNVDDIPKVLNEIKSRNLSLNASNVNKVVENCLKKGKRGGFNSPMNANRGTKFQFE